MRSDPNEYIYPLIQTLPLPSETIETMILRIEADSVLFLNELRHKKNTAHQLKIPLRSKQNVEVQAAYGKTGINEGIDYRGKEVLAYISPVENSEWFMVAKMDINEIRDLVESRAVSIALIVFLLIASFSIALGFVYSYKQRNIYKELWANQVEYKTTLESIGDAVISTDNSGYIRYLNPVAEAVTGWKESEVYGRHLDEVFKIINEQTRVKVESPVTKVLRQGLIVGLANHTILISKDEKEIPIADSGAPIKDKKGNIVGGSFGL